MFGRGHFENDIAANVCVPANDHTVPTPVTDGNTVCHVNFLRQKSVRRGRNPVAALPRRGDLHCYGRQFMGLATTVSGFDGVLSANWAAFSHPRRLDGREKGCVFGRRHAGMRLHVLSQRPCGQTSNIDWCVLQRQFFVVTIGFKNCASSFT